MRDKIPVAELSNATSYIVQERTDLKPLRYSATSPDFFGYWDLHYVLAVFGIHGHGRLSQCDPDMVRGDEVRAVHGPMVCLFGHLEQEIDVRNK